jgi:predicted transcriptional regulator
LALNALAIDDIDYGIMNAAILGNSLVPITRKTHLSTNVARRHLKLLEDRGQMSWTLNGSKKYYFVTEKGERSILAYEANFLS